MSLLAEMFKSLTLAPTRIAFKFVQPVFVPVRHKRIRDKDNEPFVILPIPGHGKSYRRIVHFPENYTVEPLKVTNLGGRDQLTGRKVCKKIGGGIKHKYHWVKWQRDGPADDVPPQEEKVMRIIKCGCRTANVALVAVGDEMKYILATENMKPGDVIKTSKFIPFNLVKANEGDAYPVGALPAGTKVHNIEVKPGYPFTIIHSAGTFGTIKKVIGDKVMVQMPSKQEIILEKSCMVTVGRLSNVEHGSTPIGTPQKARELGIRPSSGLWQRKTGRFGRKIKPLPPPTEFTVKKPKTELINLTYPSIESQYSCF